jgi:hypothetical protein
MDLYWLTSFWEFLQRTKLTVTLAQQWLPVQTRTGDVSLMEHSVQQGYTAYQLGQINRCRVYLQVLTLADIVSADGLCIIPDILVGAPLLDRKSTLNWPSQQRPSNKDWAVWSSALRSLQPKHKLVIPLGEWLVSSTHQQWFWYIDPILPLLYHQPESGGNWQRFKAFSSSRRTTRSGSKTIFDLAQGTNVSSLPSVLCPATVTTDKYTQLTIATRGPLLPSAPVSECTSATWISQPTTQPFYTSLLGPPPDLQPLAGMMEQCGIAVVYRTLYEPPTITNSWTLFIPGGNKYSWATSRGWTEGISSDKRLSLEGIVAVTFLLNELKREFDINGGAVMLFCPHSSATESLLQKCHKCIARQFRFIS